MMDITNDEIDNLIEEAVGKPKRLTIADMIALDMEVEPDTNDPMISRIADSC